MICLLALLTASCSDVSNTGASSGWVVFVQVPHDVGRNDEWRDPYPVGSRVVAWNVDQPDGVPRLLSKGLAAAGAPAVSPDGRRVLFAAKGDATSRWAIYETSLEGGAVRRVTALDANCLWPAYLPAERIVFASDRAGELDVADGGPSFSLYTCGIAGSSTTRVTFNPGSDIDPVVLADGRVLFASRQPPGPDRPESAWALFTIRNDGTGIAPFYGSHSGPDWKRRPRQIGDRLAFVAAEAGDGEAWIESVRLARPLHSRKRLERDGRWLSPGSWSDEAWIASHRPPSGASSLGIYRVDSADGMPRPLFDDPGFDEIEPVRAAASAGPRGHVSAVRENVTTGTVLGLDARRTDRQPKGEAARVRIFRALPSSFEDSQWQRPLRLAEELVADVALASDGSFLTEVPADTPLRFETLDAEGQKLLDSRGWIWVRPGEQRSCVGCHENRESAPPNRVPQVLAPRPRMTLEALRGESQ